MPINPIIPNLTVKQFVDIIIAIEGNKLQQIQYKQMKQLAHLNKINN